MIGLKQKRISTLSIRKNLLCGCIRRPGDFVSVSLLSASYEIDDVTGKLGQERDFYLKIECLQDGWASISSRSIKEEALSLASLFIGLRKDAAIKLWKLKKLGEKNLGDRIEK